MGINKLNILGINFVLYNLIKLNTIKIQKTQQMKNIKIIATKLFMMIVALSFVQCATSQKLDKTAPISTSEAYCQKWVAGVQEGGSGMNFYFPVEDNAEVALETIFFKGKKIKLEFKESESMYTGNYKNSVTKEKGDLIMSDDPKEEFKNQAPIIEEKIPFELKEGECVIEYSKNGKKGYFKLDKLREKQMIAYPSAPPVKKGI